MQLIDKIVIETLTVDSVAWSDAGFYECVATNSLGVVVGNTTINVEGNSYNLDHLCHLHINKYTEKFGIFN